MLKSEVTNSRCMPILTNL